LTKACSSYKIVQTFTQMSITMNWLFISSDQVLAFVKSLTDSKTLIAPTLEEDSWHLQVQVPESLNEFPTSPYRATESLKTFLFTPSESVGEDVPTVQETIIFGAKSCDLPPLKILDKLFLEGAFEDPFYSVRRKKTIVIAEDCTDCLPTCFCVAVGLQPYSEESADLIFSEVEGGKLVAAPTERGKELLKEFEESFSAASESQLSEQKEKREAIKEKVKASLKEQGIEIPENIAEVLQKKWPDKVWEKVAETCVECGACNFVCPSCHCFLLTDALTSSGEALRSRVWDACLSENFTRVAGGANPNKQREVRLRHRLERKFIAPYEAEEGYACSGCGRCIDACIGKLDLRKIIQEVANA